MKQLTWLASERRLGGEDSEEDHSPGSQNSQEEISEEEEEGLAKGEEEAGEHRCSEAAGGGAPGGERLPRGTGKTLGRGRGQSGVYSLYIFIQSLIKGLSFISLLLDMLA